MIAIEIGLRANKNEKKKSVLIQTQTYTHKINDCNWSEPMLSLEA